MTQSEETTLRLMCGALKGIEENTNEENTEAQLKRVREKLEALVTGIPFVENKDY